MSQPIATQNAPAVLSPSDLANKIFRGLVYLLPRADIDKLAAHYCGLAPVTLHSREWLTGKIIGADCARMRRDVGHMTLQHVTHGQ